MDGDQMAIDIQTIHAVIEPVARQLFIKFRVNRIERPKINEKQSQAQSKNQGCRQMQIGKMLGLLPHIRCWLFLGEGRGGLGSNACAEKGSPRQSVLSGVKF